ncbi:MAG: FprA family A-type flavoprotein [Clostridia bacterium]|nr:FprA family A-type flavoprotein [Clostridia bacterium]
MYNIKNVTEDTFWIGVEDKKIGLFENVFPVPDGISYNSYFVDDEKTVLIDTSDKAIADLFFQNLDHVLNGRKLDYLIINHMEPDHCALIGEVCAKHPDVEIVCNKKAENLIHQFFEDLDVKIKIINEGDTLNTGKHEFVFYMAPMVHWPETIVTYDKTTKALYSGDAFGIFGGLNGDIFANPDRFEDSWLPNARRYYSNIVGKYGMQVQNLLKKAANLDIDMLCPLHGPVINENLEKYIEKYDLWSRFEPEEKSCCIAYASVYGHTENVCNILAAKLEERGVRNIQMYDVSRIDHSYILSDIFYASNLILASITYNNGLFAKMDELLAHITTHNIQNRTVTIIENGSWVPQAGKKIEELLSDLKNLTFTETKLTIKSALKKDQLEILDKIADEIYASMK